MPLPIVFSRHYALGRAPTRGAPDCLLSAFGPGKGTHKGCPYRLSSLGVWPWEGHPQGVPLPIGFSRRYALRRAPTRGAPADWLLSVFCPEKGTHKGCPYRLSSLGVMPCEGHPQGVPPIVFFRRLARGRAPTRGAPTDCLLSAFGPGKGTHKGCPYRLLLSAFGPGKGTHKGRPCRLSSLGVLGRAPTRGAPTDCLLSPREGRPQGVPPIVFFRRLALGRAPTRGAPTRFRQPYVGLSQFDAIGLRGGRESQGFGEPLSESGFAGFLGIFRNAGDGSVSVRWLGIRLWQVTD